MDRREFWKARLEAHRTAIVAGGDVELERPGDGETVEKPDEDVAPHTEMNQVIASKRNQSRSGTLADIDAALARLEEDPEGFGSCLDCGEAIPRRRLELMPWVERCVQCQEEDESHRSTGPRRHITDYR